MVKPAAAPPVKADAEPRQAGSSNHRHVSRGCLPATGGLRTARRGRAGGLGSQWRTGPLRDTVQRVRVLVGDGWAKTARTSRGTSAASADGSTRATAAAVPERPDDSAVDLCFFPIATTFGSSATCHTILMIQQSPCSGGTLLRGLRAGMFGAIVSQSDLIEPDINVVQSTRTTGSRSARMRF